MQERNMIPNEVLRRFHDALGEIGFSEIEAPGVYYMTVEGYGEVYAVEHTSPVISDAAKQFGRQLEALPEYLLYPFEQEQGCSKIIAYEVEKGKVLGQLPGHDSTTLHELAVYAAEQNPAYFGTYPVPLITPWGYTVRYQAIDNGVYWLETNQCREGLAVCYPIWDSELSEEATHLGILTDYDQEHGVEETLGYLFFKKEDACVPIFEMIKTRDEWDAFGKIKIPELMNAIWVRHPDYVLGHNTREQLGQNDILSRLIAQLGVEIEPNISVENMISLYPEAGYDYLNL